MTLLKPSELTKEQHDQVEAIEKLPRRERRRLGKAWRVKIPGRNKPLTYEKGVLK